MGTKYVIAVDPSISGCGLALFRRSELIEATCAVIRRPVKCRFKASLVMAELSWEILKHWLANRMQLSDSTMVCEWPQIYGGGGGGRKDPNDLPPLAGVCAGIAMLLRPHELKSYKPREWKGTMNKGKFRKHRIMIATTPEERGRITSVGALDHNTWDAIGIGLKYLGRLEPKKVFPRG